MHDTIAKLTAAIKAYQGDIALFKHQFTGRKGAITALFKALKELPVEERQQRGQALNKLKSLAEEKLADLVSNASSEPKGTTAAGDPTLPPMYATLGSLHPLRVMEEKIVDVFQKIGFEVGEGPDIEDDWHNFSALNFPEDHPARDMQDTFFLDNSKKWLLRTHTSNVQIRILSAGEPPFRVVAPGRVFRNEAISARTHCVFHQVEAFYVHTDVSIATLKGVLLYFIQALFGEQAQLRLRPSYFPFTEPSVEVDMSCIFCAQKGCNLCKKSGWVEILGAGMIDPNVLQACDIDPEQYSGFALGMGVERIAMLYYKIQDIRLFTQNDTRFLQQFSSFH